MTRVQKSRWKTVGLVAMNVLPMAGMLLGMRGEARCAPGQGPSFLLMAGMLAFPLVLGTLALARKWKARTSTPT